MEFKIIALKQRKTTTKSHIIGAPPKVSVDGIELHLEYIRKELGKPFTPEEEQKVVEVFQRFHNDGIADFAVVPATRMETTDNEVTLGTPVAEENMPPDKESIVNTNPEFVELQEKNKALETSVEELGGALEKCTAKFISLDQEHKALKAATDGSKD